MLLIARRVFLWLKHYWYIPVIVVLLIWLTITRSDSKGLLKYFSRKQRSYRSAERKLISSYEMEAARKKRHQEAYKASIKVLEENYEKEKIKITKEKRVRVKNIVSETDGDMDALAERLKEEFNL